jgi:hypothetical protein
MRIEPYDAAHLDALIGLTLRAWEPVFGSIEQVLDTDVYQAFYPQQWQVSQRKSVVDVCEAADTQVWIAFEADAVAGFVVVKLHGDEKMGEIEMVGVDPDFQGRVIRGMGLRVGLMSRRGLGCGQWRGILRSCSGDGGRSVEIRGGC